MNLVKILIPVYKISPDKSEIASFKQCLIVLFDHPITMICSRSLDITKYLFIANEVGKSIEIERFKNEYFLCIGSYSRLLLSKLFYKRFKNYSYILIYQLDAWVFRDELKYWCNKGYDYIGAPWFEGWNTVYFNSQFIGVGNGGFSLRKVKSHIKYSSNLFFWINRNKIFMNIYKNSLFDIFKVLPRLIYRLYINNLFVLNANFKANEDYYWSDIIGENFSDFKIPEPSIALKFSFEMNPQKLYDLNGQNLPFGCHAWQKNQPFWQQFI